ncbi:DMT family transporter [Pendulispora albinea]|uniref:DMT family transporter n=1 Tax=Pendulispora albinea TaxID=2741071 RepID=A0ABZ2LTN0_9BACT
MSSQTRGYAYLSLAMVGVGSTVIASKVIASGLSPFTATALRFAVAFPLFLGLMRLTGTPWPRPGWRDTVLLVLQAAAGSVGYTTLLISGLRWTSAADAGVIIGTLPIVSGAISIVVLGERPRRSLLMAIALAAIGVLVITFRTDSGDGAGGAGRAGHAWIGNALIFGAVVCEGLFILLNKRLRADIPPLSLSTIMTGVGLVVAALFALFERPWATSMTTGSLAAVFYYALVPTVGGFLLWYAGSSRVSGAQASLFTALAPVSAVLFAFVVLGEPIGVNQMIGIGCVLVAVLGFGSPKKSSPALAR